MYYICKIFVLQDNGGGACALRTLSGHDTVENLLTFPVVESNRATHSMFLFYQYILIIWELLLISYTQ